MNWKRNSVHTSIIPHPLCIHITYFSINKGWNVLFEFFSALLPLCRSIYHLFRKSCLSAVCYISYLNWNSDFYLKKKTEMKVKWWSDLQVGVTNNKKIYFLDNLAPKKLLSFWERKSGYNSYLRTFIFLTLC